MVENKVVAVDLGGSNLRVALVKGKRIIESYRIPTPKKSLN